MTTFEELGSQHLSGSRNRDVQMLVGKRGGGEGPANDVSKITIQNYLSKLRRDSIGADFQSVRKLTNYVYAKSLELRLRAFRNICKARKRYPRCGGCGY